MVKRESPKGKLSIVGFGPGNQEHITPKAFRTIQEASVVVGYKTYIRLVQALVEGKRIIKTGMAQELERAGLALDEALKGETVALVSSGDAGIYGMAGLVLELCRSRGVIPGKGLEVEVIPGITALSAAASLLGAPIMHDFAAISLSDHLTPWEIIRSRIEATARADFVVALYNPASGKRPWQVVEARDILLEHRDNKTPVGIVKSAYREGQNIVLTDLACMLDHDIGMLTTILVGNSQSFVFEGWMVTPRGYSRKYTEAFRPDAVDASDCHSKKEPA
jgi:precorrin-3B C17-methyltransferase